MSVIVPTTESFHARPYRPSGSESSFDGYLVRTKALNTAIIAFVICYAVTCFLVLLALFLRDRVKRKEKDPATNVNRVEAPIATRQRQPQSPLDTNQALPVIERSATDNAGQTFSFLHDNTVSTNSNTNRKEGQFSGIASIETDARNHPDSSLYSQEESDNDRHNRNAEIYENRVETFVADDRASAVPSVATTSRLRESPQRNGVAQRRLSFAKNLSSTRWKHHRSMGKSAALRRQVESERQLHISGEESASRSRSRASHSRSSRLSVPNSRIGPNPRGGLSDLANDVLREERVEGEAEFYRQRYVNRYQRRRTATPSIADSSVSALSALPVTAITPEDAADAHDIGRAPLFSDYQTSTDCCGRSYLFSPLGTLLDMVEFDFEMKRLLAIALPSIVSSIVDPLFRLIVVGVVSYLINTESAIAFVLSLLLLRISIDPISCSITDIQFSMVQRHLSEGGDSGYLLSGRHIKIGVVMQTLLCTPVCIVWALFMFDVIHWLTSVEAIAEEGRRYTKIIVIDFVVQAVSKSWMLVFQVTDQGYLEIHTDLFATIASLVVVPVAIALATNPTLELVAWIQVIIGVIKFLIKCTFVVFRGWMLPYRQGLFECACGSIISHIPVYLLSALPIFVGSLVETSEWYILIFFVQYLGGAEVSAWAILGLVWDLIDVFKEGFGDAAAVRISYYLTENLPFDAHVLFHRVLLLSIGLAFSFLSILYMAGPNIVVALTNDQTLQNIMLDTIGFTGLASIGFTFAQVLWNVSGVQGNFSQASAIILISRWCVTLPFVLACIYAYKLALASLAAGIATGYATATLLLAVVVFKTEWEKCTAAAQQQEQKEEDGSMFDPDVLDDDRSSSDDDDL